MTEATWKSKEFESSFVEWKEIFFQRTCIRMAALVDYQSILSTKTL